MQDRLIPIAVIAAARSPGLAIVQAQPRGPARGSAATAVRCGAPMRPRAGLPWPRAASFAVTLPLPLLSGCAFGGPHGLMSPRTLDMLLFVGLLVGALLLVPALRDRLGRRRDDVPPKPGPGRCSARELLDWRYAAGEIDRDTWLRGCADLSAGPQGTERRE